MLSFQNIYEEAQAQTEDDSSATLTLLKRAINQGHKKFAALLRRDWRVTEKTFSTVADQQYYQMPEDCIRPKSVSIAVGTVTYPLVEVADELQWRRLNQRTTSADRPVYFYVKGEDQFGIWPTPAAVNTGTLAYEPRIRDLSQADYATGTVAVANNSAAVVGSGTTFTATMVGRSLKLNDPSGDGMWYKIASFTDTTHITLENTYAGLTASGVSYVIGEMPDIPEEYHESLIDYALYRYYLRRRDIQLAGEMKSVVQEAIDECKMMYGSKISSQYARVNPQFRTENPWTREPDAVS